MRFVVSGKLREIINYAREHAVTHTYSVVIRGKGGNGVPRLMGRAI